MDEEMVSMDPIGFHSEDEPYRDRYDAYQRMTGLVEAVQTGIDHISGIPMVIGVMDFQFMGGSMGSVVGEKITRLIEHAADQSLPVILACAFGAHARGKSEFDANGQDKLCFTLLPIREEVVLCGSPYFSYNRWIPRSILKGVLSELLQLHGFLHAPTPFEQSGRGGDDDWGEEDYNAEAKGSGLGSVRGAASAN
ncbi:hypothetical protein QJS10_CPA03g01324 [Acorus calamus]|uniref:CoA carboxyltransferase N-terminal domain-containing protein n=1 Tax=Acorus calamus TaxID=4465 RepID=A0AAV9F8K4_ACOCL|nr:hypothetical protein QJS10_CPA03g01324 [Acorus calamus]